MRKIIILLLALMISFADCEARPGKRKNRKRKHYTKERVSIHHVTKTEKVVFAVVAGGLLWWSYQRD